MKKTIFALILIALIILQGCITEHPPIDLNEQVEVYKRVYVDVGGNGDQDVILLEFNPLSVVSGTQKFTVKRSIFIYDEKFKETHIQGAVEASKVLEAVDELDSSFSNIQKSCSDSFNIDLCLDPKSCTSACSYGSTVCSRSVDEGVGVIILDYANHQRKLLAYLTSLKEILSGETGLVSNSDISEYIAGAYLEKEILKNHPANVRFIGCNFAYLKSSKFDELANEMGIEVSPLQYNGIVFMELKGYQLVDVVDVSMREKIPSKVYSKTIDLALRKSDKITQTIPIEIDYSSSRITGLAYQIIPYTIKLKPSFDPVVGDEWKNVVVIVKFISYEIPLLESATSILFYVYKIFYSLTGLSAFSFSFSIFTGLLVLIVIWEILKVVYFVVVGFTRGRNAKKSIELAFGTAKEKPVRKAIKAVGLLALALGIELFLLEPYKIQDFGFFELKKFLESNSFTPISVAAFIYSFIVLSDILGDIIKGTIVGKSYYKNLIESTPRMNRLRLEKLKELIVEAKKELDDYSAKGIEVSEEYDVIIRIPIEELEANVDKEDPYLMRGRLDKYIEEVKEVMSSLKTKESIAEKNWENWKQYLAEELEKREMLNLDTLLLIPHQWRVWAITKYMEENPEEDLVFEGKMIKRKATSPEEKVKRLISLFLDRNVLVAAVVLSKYSPIAYSSTLPKEGLMLNLLMTLYSVAMEFISSFKGSKIREFKAYTKKYIIGSVYYGNYHIVYIALREKEKELKDLFSRLKKI